MATGTGPIDAQDVLNKVWNPAGTGPSPTGDSLSVYMLPGSGQNTPFLGSGTFQGLGPNPLVVVQPAFRQFVLDSVTTGSASATGTVATGLGGYRHASFYISFATFTGTVSTMNLFIDSRLDGTNWVNLFFVSYLSATAGTVRDVVVLRKDAFATGNIANNSAYISVIGDLATGSARQIGWGDDLRIRRDVSGGTTAPIFTYTVTVNLTA